MSLLFIFVGGGNSFGDVDILKQVAVLLLLIPHAVFASAVPLLPSMVHAQVQCGRAIE